MFYFLITKCNYFSMPGGFSNVECFCSETVQAPTTLTWFVLIVIINNLKWDGRTYLMFSNFNRCTYKKQRNTTDFRFFRTLTIKSIEVILYYWNVNVDCRHPPNLLQCFVYVDKLSRCNVIWILLFART